MRKPVPRRLGLPGEGPIEVTCENARLVARLCELVGFGELEGPELAEYEQLTAQLGPEAGVADGEWYLPPED